MSLALFADNANETANRMMIIALYKMLYILSSPRLCINDSNFFVIGKANISAVIDVTRPGMNLFGLPETESVIFGITIDRIYQSPWEKLSARNITQAIMTPNKTKICQSVFTL